MSTRMKRILSLAALCCLAAAPILAEELFFSRDFPGSGPPYFDVTVRADGSGGYREALDEEPLEFQIDEKTVRTLWDGWKAVAPRADQLASKRKVAFTGDKILRFTDAGGEPVEARFSYTEDEEARALMAWFMNAGETARHRINLERAVRFDRLGVNDALLGLQSSMDRGRVVAAEQLLPVLEQIVGQERILHLARSRAAAIIERIQSSVNSE